MNTLRTFYNNKVVPALNRWIDYNVQLLSRLALPALAIAFLFFVVGGMFVYTGAGPIWVPLAFFMAVFFLSSPVGFFRYIWYLIAGN